MAHSISWPRLWLLLVLYCAPALIGVVDALAGVPLPKDAEAAALAVIDDLRRLDPELPRPDEIPIAVGPGSVDLPRALAIALANNCAMQTAREQLREKALGVIAVKGGYYPQWRAESTASVNLNICGTPSVDCTALSSQSIGFTQALPFGGSLALDFGGSLSQCENGAATYSPKVAISISQPLLRGAGLELYQEPLLATRRELLYALRDYKMRRQDFAVSVISDYLTIQTLREKRKNLETKRTGYDDLIKREKAFYELGRESELEFLRATQEFLLVKQEVLNLDLDLSTRIESFAITLNLPMETRIEMVPFPIPYTKLRLDPQEAVRLALERRPDLQSAAGAVEDSRRALRFSRRDLLPKLDMNLGGSVSNSDVRSHNGVRSEEFTAGLSLSLPLERTQERLALFNAWQTLRQNERMLEYARGTVSVAIHNCVNSLSSTESAIAIQDSIVATGARRADVVQYLYDHGQVSNREVIDANSIRINAANAKLDLVLAHYIGKLRLMREIGTLNVNRPTTFIEAAL